MNVNQAWRKLKAELKDVSVEDYGKVCFFAGIAFAMDKQRESQAKNDAKLEKEVEALAQKMGIKI